MPCKNCPYYIESNNGYEYCAYFCEDINRIKQLSMCKWLEEIYEDSSTFYSSGTNGDEHN